MANPTPGGRIIPIVMPRQDGLPSPPSETNQPQSRRQTRQSPLGQPGSSMVTRSQTAQFRCLELPSLNERGLYALPTEGDGNCLYYALSDQLYGTFSHGDEIRSRLADHISANKNYFLSFISAGGELRRGPKRAAASATKYSSSPSSASPTPPSAMDPENSFDTRVAESRRNGVWGGAEEIQAFCQSFGADVNVYTTYGVQSFRDVNAPQGEERQLLHVAFHDFNHYSSVRHAHGPHTGLPCIPRDTSVANADEELRRSTKKEVDEVEATHIQGEGDEPWTSRGTVVNMATPWKISAIQEGLGGKYDRETIVGMLQQCRGNIDRAFANLLGECADSPWAEGQASASRAIMKSRLQPPSSRSSSPFSTASKRSADDSESEEEPRPAVRRSRTREKKRRALPDVTVGIAFRDDQNDLVSLRLRVSPEAVEDKATAPSGGVPEPMSAPEQEPSPGDEQMPRRSRRGTTTRSASRAV